MGGIGHAISTLPVLLVGLLITGFVVGVSSHDPGLALRGIVAGVMVPPLVGALALALGACLRMVMPTNLHPIPRRSGAANGFVMFIPVAIGFGIGRLLWDKFQSVDRGNSETGR